MSETGGLRVRLHATDAVRRRGLAAILEAAGHGLTDDTPDVELCDLAPGVVPPREAEAPVVLLTDRAPDGFRAGWDEAPGPPLTPREAEILSLVGQGLSNKSVARRLGISVHTVKFHLEALFAKLEATSRAEAVAKGLRGGVIEL